MAASLQQFQMLMARVGCARLIVAKARGKPEERLVSRVQKDGVIAAMSKDAGLLQGLSSDDRGKLLALLSQCHFHDDDMKAILTLLSPPEREKKQRAPMQKFYPQILHYFREDEWAAMEKARQLHLIAPKIVERILALGGRNVSERCMASIVACMLWMCGAMALDMDAKTRILAFVKAEYKRRVRACRFVGPYLANLPDPDSLQEQWPDLWRSVFGIDGQPSRSPLITAATALPTMRCRVSKKLQREMQLLTQGSRFELPGELVQLMKAMQRSHSDLIGMAFNPGAQLQQSASLQSMISLQ